MALEFPVLLLNSSFKDGLRFWGRILAILPTVPYFFTCAYEEGIKRKKGVHCAPYFLGNSMYVLPMLHRKPDYLSKS